MTNIRSGAPRVATPSVSSSAPTAASKSSAATGSSSPTSQTAASSFQPATSGGKETLQGVLDGAKNALKDVNSDAKKDFLAFLDKPFPTAKEQEAGLAAFEKLAASGDLSEDQLKSMTKAVAWRMAGRTAVQSMLAQMEKFVSEIQNRKRPD